MEKLNRHGYDYDRISVDNNNLIKKSVLSFESAKYMKSLDFDFILKPTEVIKTKNGSLLVYPYLRHYKDLSEIKRKYSDKVILILLAKQLKFIQSLHKNNIIHSDIFPPNIMINDYLNMKIIDFDAAVINSTITEECIYEDLDINTIIDKCILEDKTNTLSMYLFRLLNGYFKDEYEFDLNIDKLNIEPQIKYKFQQLLFKETKIDDDDYLFDEVRFLLKKQDKYLN